MTSMNPVVLRNKLLRPWQNCHPIVQGMQRAAAWEIMLDQYFLPDEGDESVPTNQNQPDNPPDTSE